MIEKFMRERHRSQQQQCISSCCCAYTCITSNYVLVFGRVLFSTLYTIQPNYSFINIYDELNVKL